MAELIDYCLTHFPAPPPPEDAPDRDNPAIRLMHAVVERMADLAASYMVAGFVHGVLNTDNMNISGESFDYGPWRWLPRWDPAFTAAYFDHQGLYSFGRQPEAVFWNLQQLAACLTLVADQAGLLAALNGFSMVASAPSLAAWASTSNPARPPEIAMIGRSGSWARGRQAVWPSRASM